MAQSQTELQWQRPSGVEAATIGPILALGNKRLRRGRDRDAEAVRLLRGNLDSGVVLLGFEDNQRIGFFKLNGGRVTSPQRYLRPPVRLRDNKGIEATGCPSRRSSKRRHRCVCRTHAQS